MEKRELMNVLDLRSNCSRLFLRPIALLPLGAIALLPLGAIASGATHPSLTGAADEIGSLPTSDAPKIVQRIRVRDVWRQVYEQLPELPLENEYVDLETGAVDPEDTLISRFIRYHVYVKGRPPQYRLDWKLTLADYLGAHDLMFEGVYPGGDELDRNPMYGDRETIASLTRTERNDLVHTLTSLFNPQYLPLLEAAAQQNDPQSPEERPQRDDRTPPRQPQPGDAELLLP